MYHITNFDAYKAQYAFAKDNPSAFWGAIADNFSWGKGWHTVSESDFLKGENQWYLGATTNISVNALDRWVTTCPNRVAIITEPNNPDIASEAITYAELHQRVCKMANALLSLGVGFGDTVCIYMPMIPAALIGMLACARIGAIHTVVFAGFSAQSVADRISESGCKLVLTADGGYRGAKDLALKVVIDNALALLAEGGKGISTIVYKHTGINIDIKEGKDFWWHTLEANASPNHIAQQFDAQHPLFILYTSGSTGKPKGVVHATGGYMVYAGYTFKNVFQYTEGDVFFCTADVGWVTGHSYLLYGALLNGATTLLFEGIPTWPDASRFWQIIDKHQVNTFYTAPTAIRSLMAMGDGFLDGYKLDSLKVLGSVGEPINEEAWHWYHDKVGKGRCPITDTWWQTETGGVMIAGLAGITPMQPAYAGLPLPGIVPILLDAEGKELTNAEAEGSLCLKQSWPGIIRTTYGDHKRCIEAYFSSHKGYYFTGDGAKREANGYIRILGRVDDVINVSGHRLGTAELESAINEHIAIIESAVVGYNHSIKGTAIYAYVVPVDMGLVHPATITAEIGAIVTAQIGAIARPDKVQVCSALPKTRSGKIMRRILRKIAEGETDNLGDLSTLLDPDVVRQLIAGKVS